MLTILPWRRSLKEILDHPLGTAEDILRAEIVARPMVRFREHYDKTLIIASGITLPPHERLMIHQTMLGAPENINVSSRGTSKSTAVCVLAATLMAVLYSKKKILELSATGFRGGQSIFNEIERWACGLGKWDSQLPDVMFMASSIEVGQRNKSLVNRAPNSWQIKFHSHTVMRTLPTNDEDRIRGERAHIVLFDEANTADETLISKVIRPFLAVKGGFDTGGAEAQSNQAFFTSTIDFSWRPFVAAVQAAKDGLRRDMDAMHSAQRGDWDTHAALSRLGLLGYTYTSFDYTDTIVREELTDREGRRYKVNYPNANLLVGRPELYFKEFPRGIPFTTRGDDGRVQRDSPTAIQALTTYPIDSELIERPLYDGSIEESMWLAEQRNVLDTAGGDVYPHGLMDKISSVGTNCIYPWDFCGENWKARYPEATDQGYYAPIMWQCDDPCILGVDVASGARDFAAFTVIRIGPLSSGDFDAVGGARIGHTDWSNVIWTEQHRSLSYKEIADKILALKSRYNLFSVYEPWKSDWEWCRSIGMDAKGGGMAVRDALIHLDRPDEDLGEGIVRIYDPFDDDPKVQGFKKQPNLPILDLIAAQDTTNDQLVEFTLAQMKVGRLYLPKWLEESQRPDRDPKLNPGYLGIRTLENQLRRIQQEPTARARRFFMPGNSEDVKNKKDAWASFIYAAKQLRAHLLRVKSIENRPPAMGASVSRVNSKKGSGHLRGRMRSPGGKI